MGVAFKFFQICQTMPWLSYILITSNLFNNKNVRIIYLNFQYSFIQLQFSNKNIKSNTLKFSKLMIFMQHMKQMHQTHQIAFMFFTNFPGVTPRTPFSCRDPESGPFSPKSWLRACVLGLWILVSPLSVLTFGQIKYRTEPWLPELWSQVGHPLNSGWVDPIVDRWSIYLVLLPSRFHYPQHRYPRVHAN